MSKKFWWIAGGLIGAGVAAVVASMAVLRTEAPHDLLDAAEETPGVDEAFAYRESTLLGRDKTAGVNLVLSAADRDDAQRAVREAFANVEQAMLVHGYDTLTITARNQAGDVVIEATNVDGPLSVIELPVTPAQASELAELPLEMLDDHIENVVLGE